MTSIRSRSCRRCRLQYSYREKQCLHCLGLSDAEAKQLKASYKKQAVKVNTSLANNFFLLLAGIALLLLVFSL